MSVPGVNSNQSAQDQAQKQAEQQRSQRHHEQNVQAAAEQREIHGKNILRANQENRSQSFDDDGNPQPLPGDSINVQYFT